MTSILPNQAVHLPLALPLSFFAMSLPVRDVAQILLRISLCLLHNLIVSPENISDDKLE
jgi:hypothetical protein